MRKHVDICWPLLTYVPCWNPSRSTKLCATCQATRRRLFPDPPRLWCKGTQGRAWTWWHLVAIGGYSDLQCSSSHCGGKDGLGSEKLGTPCLSSRTSGVYAKRLPHAGCQRPTALHPTCCPKQSWSFRNPNCSFSILYNMIAHLSSGTRPTRTTDRLVFVFRFTCRWTGRI